MKHNFRLNHCVAIIALLAICIGCGASAPEGPQSDMADLAEMLDEAPAKPPIEVKPDPPIPAPAAKEEPQVVTAKTPKKGKSLHDQGTYLSAVGSARFRAEHQMILNQVKHALELYRAGPGEGNYPTSHEEFMDKVIKPNLIALPELEEGYEYWYDAEDHQLKQRQIQSGN